MIAPHMLTQNDIHPVNRMTTRRARVHRLAQLARIGISEAKCNEDIARTSRNVRKESERAHKLNEAWRRWYANVGGYERFALLKSVKIARSLEEVAQIAAAELDAECESKRVVMATALIEIASLKAQLENQTAKVVYLNEVNGRRDDEITSLRAQIAAMTTQPSPPVYEAPEAKYRIMYADAIRRATAAENENAQLRRQLGLKTDHLLIGGAS